MYSVIIPAILAFSPIAWSAPGAVSDASPHYDLEQLYSQGAFQELDKELDARLASAPDADLYWMKARSLYELGELIDRASGVDMVAHYQQMAQMAEKGLELRPDDPHIRFGHGIALARLGTTKGVLSSLFLARSVEADWLAATKGTYASIGGEEVLPADAYQALGIFYRLVPDWWIVQVVAGTRGDLDKSLEFHQKSVGYRPSIAAYKELGVTQLCIAERRGNATMRTSGMASLEKVLTMPAKAEKHRIDHAHAKMLMADPSLACEYSRDGQQDLDKKKMEGK